MKNILLFGLLILPYIVSGQIEAYQHQSISGFNVYIELSALDNHKKETTEAIDLLSSQLREVEKLGLKGEIIDSLRAVSIFMEWENNAGAAEYHPGLQWLIDNGYIPEKWKSVEISNIRNFIDWTALNQPSMILHELAHAYHHRVLGFDYLPILEAYNEAVKNALYDSVSLHTGNENYVKKEAYAKTNHLEYFAELTEAYLGQNDFFPFIKEELKNHDLSGYKVVLGIWQLESKK